MYEIEPIINDVWQMTVRSYEAEGVKQDCLFLQERYGVGVSAWFALLSLAVLGYRLCDESSLTAVLSRAETWQDEVIKPLRSARKAARLEQGSVDEMDAVAAVRKRLLAEEIAAEAIQQQLLITDYQAHTRLTTPADDEALLSLASDYVGLYASQPDEADQAAIKRVVAAFANQRS